VTLGGSLSAEGGSDFSSSDLLAHPKASWLTNGGNLYNQRFSPLEQINTENVHKLKGVWHVRLNGSGVGPPYSGEAQPIVHDGIMYVVTGADDVFAIRIDSGEFAWVYESGLDPEISTACCGWTSRGVAIGEGKLFLGRLDGKLVALNLADGEELWSVQAERWEEGFTITSAPLYYDGMVITGFGGAEYGVRGRVKAFRARDGSSIWTFYTVPGPGELGHETWPKDSEIWKRGGATVWHTPAVDPELGLLYFSTGNPGPDFNGSLRKGDNLFSVSMVALDARTGDYRWHFQQVHHDIWDYDASTPVVLFDVEIDGRPRKAIAEAGKTGWVYILDRTDGTPLLGIPEKPVPQEPRQHTSPTQPTPVGDAFVPQEMEMPLYGYPFVNRGRIFTPFWQKVIPIRPGTFGGTTWAPPSYDPRTHSLFVCGLDNIGLFTGGTIDGQKSQEQFLGGEFIFDTVRTGIFAAMNLQTNRLVWRHRWEESCYSGSTATAGDVVFVGMNDGRFVALDSKNGDALWEFQTGAGVNAPPAVFEHDGEQMVAVYAAGALFAQSPPGDSVWLFALSGLLEAVPPGTPSSTGAIQTGGAVQGKEGAKLYGRYCGQCHGNERQGGHGGGPALPSSLDPKQVLMMVTRGNAQMPGFGGQLTYDQVQQLVAYLTEEDPSPTD
jgi:alcohol dehydrogenase (cytochrome c)